MANKRLSEGVGKKIVEALKKQSEIEVNPVPTEKTEENEFLQQEPFIVEEPQITSDFECEDEELLECLSFNTNGQSTDEEIAINETHFSQQENPLIHPQAQPSSQTFVGYEQPNLTMSDNFASELDNFEIPSNIAALKKLITQLPAGVTRQTGAQIIRQTMEALGISMKSVLQEAQQVQDGLSNSAKECQNTIQEYKKHIVTLEKQCHSHQKQYSALNELISLFIQTGR